MLSLLRRIYKQDLIERKIIPFIFYLNFNDQPVFKTPAPDGPFRDEVVVDILSIDGVHYAGTITPVEARKMIYESALGLSQDNLASITIGFNSIRGLPLLGVYLY